MWGLAADPAGGVRLTCHTAGDLAGTSAGDKDILVARADADGVLTWRDQFGTSGNDKGTATAADAYAEADLYLTVTPGGTQLSGLNGADVFRTRLTSDGTNTLPWNVWWAPRPRSGRASHGRTTT